MHIFLLAILPLQKPIIYFITKILLFSSKRVATLCCNLMKLIKNRNMIKGDIYFFFSTGK